MNRTPETASAWRTLAAPLRSAPPEPPRLEAAELRGHRLDRAAFVRWQIERAEADRRAVTLLAVLVLAANALLLGANAVACGLQPGGWLAWPLLALALLSGGLLVVSAALAALSLWRKEPGPGEVSATPLANPHATAAAFADAASLRGHFHQALQAELERQAEAEWLRLAKAARAQWRALVWAAGFSVAALAVTALGVVVLAASGL